MCNYGLRVKNSLCVWIALLGRKRAFFSIQWIVSDYLDHLQVLFLANGSWGLKETGVFFSPSWNGNCRALLVSVSFQPRLPLSAHTLFYTGCFQDSHGRDWTFQRDLYIVVLGLSQCTQLFSANALWGLGSVFKRRSVLSTSASVLIVLFDVYILACSWVWGHCPSVCSWKDRAHTVGQEQSQQNSEEDLISAYSYATVTIDFYRKKK